MLWRRLQGIRRQTISKELVCLRRGLQLADIPGPNYWPKLAKDKPNPKIASKEHSRERWIEWLNLLPQEARDVAVFAILTGLRKEELYRVTRDDLNGRMLKVHEKGQRPESRRVWLTDTALKIFQRAVPFKQSHRTAYRLYALRTGTTNITLRDCRAAFATAADLAGDLRATNIAMGHSGIPARYQKSDMERLRRVAEAVETWLGYISEGTSGKARKSSAEM